MSALRHIARSGLSLSVVLANPVEARPLSTVIDLGSLQGQWLGDGLALTINADTLQANMDPAKPFEWQTFRLVNVSGKFVVFDVGRARFIGLLDPEHATMTVTVANSTNQYSLHHTRR